MVRARPMRTRVVAGSLQAYAVGLRLSAQRNPVAPMTKTTQEQVRAVAMHAQS